MAAGCVVLDAFGGMTSALASNHAKRCESIVQKFANILHNEENCLQLAAV